MRVFDNVYRIYSIWMDRMRHMTEKLRNAP